MFPLVKMTEKHGDEPIHLTNIKNLGRIKVVISGKYKNLNKITKI